MMWRVCQGMFFVYSLFKKGMANGRVCAGITG